MHKLTHSPTYNTGIHTEGVPEKIGIWQNSSINTEGSKVTPTCSAAVWDDAAFQTRSCFIPVHTGSEFILVQGQCSGVTWNPCGSSIQQRSIFKNRSVFMFKWLFIHSCVFRRRRPCKMSQKTEEGWYKLTSLFQSVKYFTMCHSVSDSSTVILARETPAPLPLLPNLIKIIRTRCIATCAEHINTVPFVSEEVKDLKALVLSKFPTTFWNTNDRRKEWMNYYVSGNVSNTAHQNRVKFKTNPSYKHFNKYIFIYSFCRQIYTSEEGSRTL